MVLERSYRFSASHRYYRPEWSEEENFARFGRCSWGPGHGHNYRVTLWIEGTPDPLTGFVIDLPKLDEVVREEVLDRLDHRKVDVAIEEFRSGALIPSSENLVSWIAARLLTKVSGLRGGTGSIRLRRVRLAEDDDLGAEWIAEGAG